MDIYEIAETLIRNEKALVFPLKLNGSTWVSDQAGHHVLDIRGWGYLQYHEKGDQLQDGIAEWVVKTLNEAYEKGKVSRDISQTIKNNQSK